MCLNDRNSGVMCAWIVSELVKPTQRQTNDAAPLTAGVNEVDQLGEGDLVDALYGDTGCVRFGHRPREHGVEVLRAGGQHVPMRRQVRLARLEHHVAKLPVTERGNAARGELRQY